VFQRAKYLESSDKKTWRALEDPIGTAKIDGANFFVQIDSKGKPHYISRRLSVKGTYPERTSALPHLDFTVPELAGQVFNAEVFHSGFNKTQVESHPTISGILNSLPPRAVETQGRIGPARVALHNVINPEFPTYKEKLEHLKKVEKLIGKPDLIFVPQIYSGHEAIDNLIRRTKERGQEGVIITSLTKPESEGNVRFKIKHKLTYNLEVSDIIQEVDKDGNIKPSMGALVLKDATGKIVGRVGTGFSRADRIDAWNHKEKWLGRAIQVVTMGFAVNALRMPVFNGDADGDIDTVS
jgi:hypothetical protein